MHSCGERADLVELGILTGELLFMLEISRLKIKVTEDEWKPLSVVSDGFGMGIASVGMGQC